MVYRLYLCSNDKLINGEILLISETDLRLSRFVHMSDREMREDGFRMREKMQEENKYGTSYEGNTLRKFPSWCWFEWPKPRGERWNYSVV